MAGRRTWAFWKRGQDGTSQDETSRSPSPRAVTWLPYLLIWPLVGIVGIWIYARHLGSASVFAVGLLVAGASLLVGSLLGFLFGIPRWLATDNPTPPEQGANGGTAANDQSGSGRYTPNTNLEQISDWLTKALVGVGLVELKSLSNALHNLTVSLQPGLGGTDSSRVFGGALVVGYSITGFIIAYLVTRIYLGRAFAEADDLTQRLHKVEEVQQEQAKNLAALNLIMRYFDAEQSDSSITQDQLNAAVSAASDLVRVQIFNMARQRRQDKPAPVQQKRAAGVFQALIAADTDNVWHRNHGQLGYARHALGSFAEAEEAFTTAIERRDARGQRGYNLYELMRAKSRVALAQAANPVGPSDPHEIEEILADFRKAARSRGLRANIEQTYDDDVRIKNWAARNNLTVADLTQPPKPAPLPGQAPADNPATNED